MSPGLSILLVLCASSILGCGSTGPAAGSDASTGGDAASDAASDAALPGDGVIGLSVQASRVSGVAPLAVHFDATATTHMNAAIDTFREVTYAFDFGDQAAGTWAISGKSKNTQVGSPLAAHVFDAPGSYVVTITATEGTHVTTTTVQIQVESPDAHWPAAQTIVVSPSGDFTGAPAGAEQRTSLPATYAGRRVLLHRGETYPAIDLPGTADDVLIGTYGTGAKPQVASVFLGGNAVVGRAHTQEPGPGGSIALDTIARIGVDFAAAALPLDPLPARAVHLQARQDQTAPFLDVEPFALEHRGPESLVHVVFAQARGTVDRGLLGSRGVVGQRNGDLVDPHVGDGIVGQFDAAQPG